MHDDKRLVEAALYISGRPLSIHEIQDATQLPTLKRIREILNELIIEYKDRGGALVLIQLPRQRFVLQLDPDLSERVATLAPHGLLSLGELKTLLYIALKQPILQSQVVEYRGSHSYKHIKQLESLGFIEAQPQGRSKELVTSQMFADYFGFDYDLDKLKIQLRRMIRRIQQQEQESMNHSSTP
jgi:segregation and condensation protein B